MGGIVSRPGNIFEDVSIKAPVRAATTAPIALNGLQTIDTVVLCGGNRVLVMNQLDETQNGIYQASFGNWCRTFDASKNTDFVTGTLVLVLFGAVNGDQLFEMTCTDQPVLIGTSLITWQELIQPNTITFAKFQQVAASSLIGNTTTAPANATNIGLGATLAFNGASLQTGAGAGDVAWAANSFATTIQPNAVTNAKMAQAAAFSFKGNPTSVAADVQDFTIASLTNKASPVGADMAMIADSAAGNALKSVLLSALVNIGNVASIAGRTGAFTLGGLLTNVSNLLEVVAAAQADQIAATSATLAVTPAQQQSHPSAAKAWASIGAAGALNAGYNISSVNNPATGSYNIIFEVPFASVEIACVAMAGNNENNIETTIVFTTKAAGGVTVEVFETSTGININANFDIAFFGTQ